MIGNKKLSIDLCSGIGRWDDETVAIDFDRKTNPTIVADVRFLPLRPKLGGHLRASPPCTYVSKARRWRYGWNPQGVSESLKLVAACYEAAAYLDSETVCIENPAGLENILGQKVQFRYKKADLPYRCTTNFYLNQKGLKRSVIPTEVRQSIMSWEQSSVKTEKQK